LTSIIGMDSSRQYHSAASNRGLQRAFRHVRLLAIGFIPAIRRACPRLAIP
jgi:hypothetical protein